MSEAIKRKKAERLGYVHGEKAQLILQEPEIAIEHARFVGSFAHQPPRSQSKDGKYSDRELLIEDRALLYLLMAAKDLRSDLARSHELS